MIIDDSPFEEMASGMSSTFTTQAPSLLQRLQRGLSAVELVHVPHGRWPNQIRPSSRPLRISVLDSSFNPPTLAHLALANSARPRYSEISVGTITRRQSVSLVDEDDEDSDYDAKLLLLSVQNADKSLKPSDATYLQRLEMMVLLAKDIVHHGRRSSTADIGQEANVAVAIINEPTFVGKSSTLHSFLRQRLADLALPSSAHAVLTLTPLAPQLTFLQGFDTLERLLSPRYYESEATMWQSLRHFFSSHGDNSRVVCARRVSSIGRITGPGQKDCRSKTMAMAKEFIESGRIVLVDISEDEQTFSSSEVRDKIIRGDDWQRMVSTMVAEYIVHHKLYIT